MVPDQLLRLAQKTLVYEGGRFARDPMVFFVLLVVVVLLLVASQCEALLRTAQINEQYNNKQQQRVTKAQVRGSWGFIVVLLLLICLFVF